MSNMKFKLNRAGVRALMQSAEMQSVLMSHAQAVKSRAGEGYECQAATGKNRAVVFVHAHTRKAMSDNLENNTLLKVIR